MTSCVPAAILRELKTLLESYGAIVVALAVIIYQPCPAHPNTSATLPLLHLARLEASYYADAATLRTVQKSTTIRKSLGLAAKIE